MHIWIGTSVEDQNVVYRIRQLRAVPAHVRFLSCEPLIGPLDFDPTGIDWVIVGGESGISRWPMKAEWVRTIRDRCSAAEVAFFFKQWGGRTPKAGGRELDGLEWNEIPTGDRGRRSRSGALPSRARVSGAAGVAGSGSPRVRSSRAPFGEGAPPREGRPLLEGC